MTFISFPSPGVFNINFPLFIYLNCTFVLPIEKPEFKKLRLIDLDDPASLKEIISKFFELTPIDLDRLR